MTFLLTGTAPGDLFLVRNVGAFVPPHDMSAGFRGSAAARLMGDPMVRERVEAGEMTLCGWHNVIEDGEVHVFDVRSGSFVAVGLAAPVLLPAHHELGLGLVLLALLGMPLRRQRRPARACCRATSTAGSAPTTCRARLLATACSAWPDDFNNLFRVLK